MTLRVGNAAGFWGDNLDAPLRLLASTELDVLTLEYLAELTMSILARQRQKDPLAGYVTDFPPLITRLASTLAERSNLTIVTNAGGVNPSACVRNIADTLMRCGLGELPIGQAWGDDILPDVDRLRQEGWDFAHFDTGQPLAEMRKPVVAANAYLGAQPMAASLNEGARIVIAGRVADASLTVAPAVARFGTGWNDFQRLAGYSVAGHLIECGAQVTGGLSHDWPTLDLERVGYPIAEIELDGSCVITKQPDSHGMVSRRTVIEQLVYEIGDPAHYLTPDVDVDFTAVSVEDIGPDRARVTGALGLESPETYKVSLAYADGYLASGQLLSYGRDCVAKAKAAAGMLLARVSAAGYELDQVHVECLGAGAGVPGLTAPPEDLREVLLRVTARDQRRPAVERFAREFAPLITGGPPGLAGYTAAASSVRPVYSYWPTLIPKSFVQPRHEVRTAKDWLR